MRPSTCLCLILGLISIVYAIPHSAPGSIDARAPKSSARGYIVTYSPSGHAKSLEECKKIDDAIVGLINVARKQMRINGEITKSQVKFTNYPVTADAKFYFTFTGPMCGKGKCLARGMDSENPTENAMVLGPGGQRLYQKGTPPGEFKPVYVITYSPGGPAIPLEELPPVDRYVLDLIQSARDKVGIKAKVTFEEAQFTNFPPSITEGELSFTFTGPLCGRQGGVCKAKAKDLRAPTQDAIVKGAQGSVLFKSGTPPDA